MKPDVHSVMPPPIDYRRKPEHHLYPIEGNGMLKGENFFVRCSCGQEIFF